MKLKLLVILMISTLLIGCGALDDSDDQSSSSVTSQTLKGLWTGTSEEQGSADTLDTIVLFINELVYILNSDEAQIGIYTVLENGSSILESDQYTYNTPDTENNFYIGTRSNIQFDMDALFATSTDLFINYDGNNRSGSITLALDTGQEDNLTLTRIAGQWDTTDSIMYINDEGGLQGSNSVTGCQWKGFLSPLNNALLTLNIERNLCPDFNQSAGDPAQGYALIDGNGVLHFIAEQPNQFLWMQFENATGTTTIEDAEEAEEVEEAEEP